jgi:TrmH family RNA methyltransferase
MKRIESRANARFKSLLALAGDAREQRQAGLTLIDGPHLVGVYSDKVGPLDCLLVSDTGLERAEIAHLVQTIRSGELLLLRDTLFRELSGVAAPSGIAAVIRIPPEPQAAPLGNCVLLDSVQDAGNVGSILRSAAAAGIADVLLGPGCAGAWTPRVLRAGQGAHFGLRLRERCDLQSLLSTHAGTSIATVARDGTSLYELDLASQPVAWIFGSEGAGISAALLGLARQRAVIPMAPGCESLNVAAAAAVCLFEGVRQGRAAARRR